MSEQVPFEIDEGAPTTPLEQAIAWARAGTAPPLHEETLPVSVRAALESARASRPGRTLTSLAFHTVVDGEEVARMGPEAELPEEAELLALSVVLGETTAADVRVVAHVLVVQVGA
jgi:hypothetical protein